MIFNNKHHTNYNNIGRAPLSPKRFLRVTYPLLIMFVLLSFFFSFKDEECITTLGFESTFYDDDIPYSSSEKFLTYIPHSQFHNQLIELKNAIVLAYLTNRTLIVPSIIQYDHKTLNIAHSPLYNLYDQLNSYTRIRKDRILCDIHNGSEHCSSDYNNYDKFSMMDWEELLDFSWVKNEVKIKHRGYDFSIEGLFNICNIPIKEKKFNSTIQDLLEDNENVYVMNHNNKYHYRFFDTVDQDNNYELKRYDEPYLIRDLQKIEKKLIHTDSLFGTTRISFKNKENIRWRADMQRSLKFSHQILLNVSSNIVNELGGFGKYLGAHIRTGDGIFKQNMESTIDHVIEGLKRNYKKEDNQIQIMDDENPSLDDCKLQNKQIIFIATDSKDPRKYLSRVFSAFPCVFTLGDFKNFVDPLKSITSTFDKNVKMSSFFYPFLDLIIIANSRDVVLTYSSTYSAYAKYYHDVLSFEKALKYV